MNSSPAYKQGYNAGRIDWLNNTKTPNPYIKLTINYTEWLLGWGDGRDQSILEIGERIDTKA